MSSETREGNVCLSFYVSNFKYIQCYSLRYLDLHSIKHTSMMKGSYKHTVLYIWYTHSIKHAFRKCVCVWGGDYLHLLLIKSFKLNILHSFYLYSYPKRVYKIGGSGNHMFKFNIAELEIAIQIRFLQNFIGHQFHFLCQEFFATQTFDCFHEVVSI